MRTSTRANLKPGFYDIKGTHCYLEPYRNDAFGTSVYNISFVNPDLESVHDFGQYTWDTYNCRGHYDPAVAKPLLPFQVIEMMFKMNRFLKVIYFINKYTTRHIRGYLDEYIY